MAKLKTQPNDLSVDEFLSGVSDDQKRQDCLALLELMKQATGAEPVMWGDSIVGFGTYQYKYASGRQGDWMQVGFSPRKQNLTLYIMSGFGRYEELMKSLGKHSTGKSCLYIKKLDDVDMPTLRTLVQESVDHVSKANQ